MPWFFKRKAGAQPSDPGHLVSQDGRTLADPDNPAVPIEVTVQDAATAPTPVTQHQAAATSFDFDNDPRVKALKSKADEADRLKAQSLDSQAEQLAASEVSARRCLPAGKDGLKALFLGALQADAANPPAQGTAGRLDALKAFCAAIPPHNLTTETIAASGSLPANLPAGTVVVPSTVGGDPNAKPSEARVRELVAMTPMGRGILDQIDQERNGHTPRS